MKRPRLVSLLSFVARRPGSRFRRALATLLAVAGLAAVTFASATDALAQSDDAPAQKKKKPKHDADDGKKGKGKKGKKGKGSVAVAASPAPAPRPEPPRPAARAPIVVKLPVTKVTLANGLRVLLQVDHTSPTVAVEVTYDVGSRDEARGRSGFAHLFEHLMFQGSANVAKGEHVTLVASHGGVLNGATSPDATRYHEVLPASELRLGLWLEADRMRSLDVSLAKFENQRQVVEEEYRMRVSGAAYGPSAIRLEELVYQGFWPYEHDAIGSLADLDGAQLDWVKDFHAHHYGPNNAVLSLAGDLDPDEAMAAVHQYFDAVPAIEVAPREEVQLPDQTSQRTAVVKDDNVRTPGVLYGWSIPSRDGSASGPKPRVGSPTPGLRDPDHYALELAALLLADGESSRLHQLLVRERGLVQEVSAEAEDRRGPSVFSIDATLAEGARVADVEKAIESEVKQLATQGPSQAELEKAHRQAQAAVVLGLQSNLARASRLADYELFFGDAKLLEGELPRYLAVTREDIKRVTARYLGPTRRTIVETYPSNPLPEPPKPAAKADAGQQAAAVAKPAGKPDKKKAAAGGRSKKKKHEP